MPPVAPPRTSSNQQAASARRSNYTTDKPSSPRQQQQYQPEYAPPRSATTNGSADPPSRNGRHYAQEASHAQDASLTETTLPIRTQQADSPRHARAQSEIVPPRDSRSRDHNPEDAAAAPTSSSPDDKRQRSRQDHSRTHHKTSKFGDFILGNTIGEGEFGKVKLGWKQDSNAQVRCIFKTQPRTTLINLQLQVAIKLIKREAVGSNPFRLAKIRREVSILRGLNHPNIVRLFEMVETDRYIGIVLEYASGGELFDYILNHRYLKDNSARRLFSQLISGVGYLHKRGIVHRDLKLENLLLDRNRNIIITDFGFANTFDPHEELTEDEELHLQDKDQVKRMGLDKVKANGTRRGDLMQTSCGSPCYAAPELVVSDSLYTGRKVDVWSCGVILYAMLAGYLPFDDDPANPEGDNINLLYKYIVSTPLTFPEYVTPHARDLLRRILVPNPRKRADLFEVARHSWLSEYSHVVEFITSSTTSPADIQNAAAHHEFSDAPMVTRSASVRDSAKAKSPAPVQVGGLAKTHGKIDSPVEPSQRTTTKDAKRRTVQVEYVAPTTQTQRGSDPAVDRYVIRGEKPLPTEPPASRDAYLRSGQARGPPVSHGATRPAREGGRSSMDGNNYPSGRPQTGGSMQSTGSMGLHNRANYGQPTAPPTLTDTNAQGRIQQPSSGDEDAYAGRASVSVPPKFARVSGFHDARVAGEGRGHKRSSTLTDISSKLLGRSGSVFGKKNKQPVGADEKQAGRKYPPVSLANAAPAGEEPGRTSIDSRMSGGRRSFSLGLGKKRSGSIAESHGSNEKNQKEKRRFSALLPTSFSLKSIGLGKDYGPGSDAGSQHDYDARRNFTAPGAAAYDDHDSQRRGTANSTPATHQRFQPVQMEGRLPTAIPAHMAQQGHFRSESASSLDHRRPPTEPQMPVSYSAYGGADGFETRRVGTSSSGRAVLHKNHKRFTDAYEQGGDVRGHEGSTGAAKRVMDFFRRRGKARAGE